MSGRRRCNRPPEVPLRALNDDIVAGDAEMSNDIRIDRLSLRVPGLDEDAARDLARLVAQGLASGQFRSAPQAGPDHPPISDYPKSDNRNSDSRTSGNRASDSRTSDSRMAGSRVSGSPNLGALSVRVAGDSGGPEGLARRIADEIWRAIG